jgi:hypothetical protein
LGNTPSAQGYDKSRVSILKEQLMTVTNGAFTRTNSFGPGAERNYPRFFMDSVHDQAASIGAGRPIFHEEERVEIIMPGNPYTRPVQRVTDEHREKWPKEYGAFKAGLEPSAEGTPIEEWPRLRRNQVLELKALGFQTVEHVANMDDQAIGRLGIGGRQLRDLAKAFLDDAVRAAALEQLSDANAKKEAELAELQRQIAELRKLLSQLSTAAAGERREAASVSAPDLGGTAAGVAAATPAVPTTTSAIAEFATVPVRRRPGKPDAASDGADAADADPGSV